MYYSIQACRAAAAMLVVLFHLGGTFAQDKYFGFKALDGPFAWGDAGVDFFFVLSGFIITLTHRGDFGRPARIGTYLRKRFSRIYPSYWIVFALLCAAAYAVPSFRQSMPESASVYLKSLALLPQNPAVVGGTGAPVLFVAWSLQYEVVFYLVIASFILARWLGCVIVVLLAANFLACVPAAACAHPLSFLASNHVLLFAIGVGVAWFAKSSLKVRRPLALALAGGIGFVLFGLFEVQMRPLALPFDRRLVYGVLSACLIAGLVRAEDSRLIDAKSRWVAWLGDSSYALYLIHIPLISILVKAIFSTSVRNHAFLVAGFVFTFFACVLAAIGFHLVFEKPILDFLNRRAPKPFAPAPARDQNVV